MFFFNYPLSFFPLAIEFPKCASNAHDPWKNPLSARLCLFVMEQGPLKSIAIFKKHENVNLTFF